MGEIPVVFSCCDVLKSFKQKLSGRTERRDWALSVIDYDNSHRWFAARSVIDCNYHQGG